MCATLFRARRVPRLSPWEISGCALDKIYSLLRYVSTVLMQKRLLKRSAPCICLMHARSFELSRTLHRWHHEWWKRSRSAGLQSSRKNLSDISRSAFLPLKIPVSKAYPVGLEFGLTSSLPGIAMPFVRSVGKDFDHLARLMHKTRKSVIEHYYMVKLRACNETGLKPEPYCRGTRRLRPRNARRSVKVTCMLGVCGYDCCISC